MGLEFARQLPAKVRRGPWTVVRGQRWAPVHCPSRLSWPDACPLQPIQSPVPSCRAIHSFPLRPQGHHTFTWALSPPFPPRPDPRSSSSSVHDQPSIPLRCQTSIHWQSLANHRHFVASSSGKPPQLLFSYYSDIFHSRRARSASTGVPGVRNSRTANASKHSQACANHPPERPLCRSKRASFENLMIHSSLFPLPSHALNSLTRCVPVFPH